MIVLFEMVLLQKLKGVKPLKIIAVGAALTGLGFALMPLARGFALRRADRGRLDHG